MTWVQLTPYEGGNPILINLDLCISMQVREDHTVLATNRVEWLVIENPVMILQQAADWKKDEK